MKTIEGIRALNRQERVVFRIIQDNQPIEQWRLIKYSIIRMTDAVACADRIARNLRKYGIIDSRPYKGKMVEWFLK